MNYLRYKYYFLTLCVIAVFASAYMYYNYIITKNISDNISEYNFDIRNYPSLSGDINNNNITIEKSDLVLEQIEASLASEETPDHIRNSLLLQKVGHLAHNQIRGVMDENKYIEGMEILSSIYNDFSEKSEKNFSTFSGAHLLQTINVLLSSCVLPSLGEKLPAPYDAEYRDFLAKGHSPKASVMLAVISFAHNADPASLNDIRIVSIRAFLSALYLDAFGNEHNDLDNDIFQKLNSDIALYSDMYESNDSNHINVLAFSSLPYAYAYDIANTYNTSSSVIEEEKNKKIDANYDKSIDLNSNSIGNSVSQNISLSHVLIFYFESLHRRYSPEKLDAEKISSLIDKYIESASYSKETKNITSMFYLNGTTEIGKWYPVRTRLLDQGIVKQYPKLEDFIENLAGITL